MDDKKKNLKVKFVESTVVDALDIYVEKIQEHLADITGQRGILGAFISDRSCIADFLESTPTGETAKHPLDPSVDIDVVTSDTPENQKIVAELAKRLGVGVEIYDYVYDVALRLKKQDE